MICAPVTVVIFDDKFGFIRPLTFRVDEYLNILNNKDVRKHFTTQTVEDITEEDFMKKERDCKLNGFPIIILTHRDSSMITDTFGIVKIIPRADGVVELSIAVKPEEQHKGYGTYCVKRILDWLHREKDIAVVHARCFTTDNAAGRFLEKCGFEMNSMADGNFYFVHLG